MTKNTASSWFLHTALPFSPGLLFCCCVLYVTLYTCSAAESNVTTTKESPLKDRTPIPQTYFFTFPEVVNPDVKDSDNIQQQLTIATPVLDKNITVKIVTYKPVAPKPIRTNFGTYVIHASKSLNLTVTSSNSSVINSTLLTVKITSSDTISVYAFDFFSKNVDAELIRPIDTLGKEYVALSLPYNDEVIWARSFFVATAVEENTTVTITKQSNESMEVSSVVSSGSLKLSSSGQQLRVVLGKRQTVSVNYRGDLTGLRISSDKPLGFSSGLNRNRLKKFCCQDHLWAHLPGVGSWGKEYLTYPTSLVSGYNGDFRNDIFYLVGAEDNTTIYLDCNSTIQLPQAMTWYTTKLDSFTGYHVFSANTPFAVTKVVQGLRQIIDPCMVALTPTSQWATTLTFAMPDTRLWDRQKYYFIVTVLMEESHTSHLRVNGQVPEIHWEKIALMGKHNNGSTDVVIVGGELTDMELSRLGRQLLVLTSVTGTSRMAAYVTGNASRRGMCFALGGEASENKDWAPEGVLLQCDKDTTPPQNVRSQTTTITTASTTTFTPAAAHAIDTTTTTTVTPDSHRVSLEDVLTTGTSTSATDTPTTVETTTQTLVAETDYYLYGESGEKDALIDTQTSLAMTTNDSNTEDAIISETVSDYYTEDAVISEAVSTLGTNPSTTVGVPVTSDAAALTMSADTTVTSKSTSATTISTAASSPKHSSLVEATSTFTRTNEDTSMTDMNSETTNSASVTTLSTSEALASSSFMPDSITKTKFFTRNPPCYCIRKCAGKKLDERIVAAEVDRIKTELLIPIRDLSSYVRKVTSAPDDRASSVTIGVVGILVICFVVIFIVSFDVLRLIVWCGN